MVTVKNVGCRFECESCHGEIEVGIRGLGFWEEAASFTVGLEMQSLMLFRFWHVILRRG